jgi:fatty acid synthase
MLNLRCFLIDDSNAPDFSVDDAFYKQQLDLGLSVNVYRDKQWGTYRHLSLSQDSNVKPRTDHCFVNLLSRGDLTSLTWMKGPLNVESKEVVEVHYSALNFRDILVATSRITLDYEMENRIKRQFICGYEFSGITKDGRRVMGLAESKAFSTHVSTDSVLMIEVPDRWTLQEAATIPLVYITVYTAFFLTTQIEKGKSILIHAGCGGVGLAAIRVALAHDLVIFTTVSSTLKTDYLLEEFPQLKREHIGNSRDTLFEQMVMNQTGGRGVDYVLNCLADDKMQASVRCLAENGFFLEVGKFDMLMKNKIQLSHFLRGITFKAVLFRVADLLKHEDKARVRHFRIFLLVSMLHMLSTYFDSPGSSQPHAKRHERRCHSTSQINSF